MSTYLGRSTSRTSGAMRGQISVLVTFLFLGSLLTNVVWYSFQDSDVILRSPAPQRERPPKTYEICEGCKELIEKIMQRYHKTWQKQDDNYQRFRAQLRSQCNGFNNAILTQANAPVGSEIVTNRKRKKTVEVTRELFSLLAKEHPFLNKTWDTCAVVGNGGILEDSRCGQKIDSAQFVIRCNLPPLEDGYEKDVGTKTSLVTANPSIFEERYGSLMTLRRPFMEKLRTYGNALLLLSPFHLSRYTAITLRAAYTINDFGGPTRPAFLNPDYHLNVTNLWLKQSLKEARLSTGLLMVSLALELCDNVHLYGFWPFNNHPHGLHNLKHHYYDDTPPKTRYHAMPDEFELLLQLHSQGVLKLHLGDCRPGKQTGREGGGGEKWERERQTGGGEGGGEKRERQTGRGEGGGEKRERQTGRGEGGGEKRERQTGRGEEGGEKRERQTGGGEGGGEKREKERQTGGGEGGGEKWERQTGRGEEGGEKWERQTGGGEGGGEKRERQMGRGEGGGEKRERQTGRGEEGGEKRERQTGGGEGGGEKRERQTGRGEGGGEKRERQTGGGEGGGEKRERQTGGGEGGGEKRERQTGRGEGGGEKRERQTGGGEGGGEKRERQTGGGEGGGEKRERQTGREEGGEKEKKVIQKRREEGGAEKTENGREDGGGEKRNGQIRREEQGEKEKRVMPKRREEGAEEEKREVKKRGRKKRVGEDKSERQKQKEEGGEEEKTERKNEGGHRGEEVKKRRKKAAKQ